MTELKGMKIKTEVFWLFKVKMVKKLEKYLKNKVCNIIGILIQNNTIFFVKPKQNFGESLQAFALAIVGYWKIKSVRGTIQ